MSLMMNLAPIRQQFGKSVPFSMEVDQLAHLPEGCQVYDTLIFFGTFYPKRLTIDLAGTVQGEITCPCSRCLKPLLFDIDVPLHGRLLFQQDTYQVMEEGMDQGDLEETYWIYDSFDYDFSYVVVEAVINALPIRPLCAEDCQGLCAQCGENLNEGSCQCKSETIDPRWAALQESLKNEEV